MLSVWLHAHKTTCIHKTKPGVNTYTVAVGVGFGVAAGSCCLCWRCCLGTGREKEPFFLVFVGHMSSTGYASGGLKLVVGPLCGFSHLVLGGTHAGSFGTSLLST